MKRIRLTRKYEKTDWGEIYYYRSPQCRFALYVYDDDSETVYLSNLFVSPSYRNNGLGNQLIDLAFDEADRLNADSLCLKVLKESFVHEWYERRGFKDLEDDGNEDYVWMIAEI